MIAAFTSNDEDDRRKRRRKRSVDSDYDSRIALNKILEPLLNFDGKKYCELIESLPLGCMRANLLELWKSNSERIRNLSTQEIITKLNSSEVSPETGHVATFVSLLGGIETNSSGFIISAKSLLTTWSLHINFTEVDSTKLGNMAGTEDWATYNTMVLEN